MNALADPVESGGPAAVVASAVQVGLIESLADPAPAAEHADRLGLDPEATSLELAALAALGIAEQRDGRFCAGEGARRLSRGESLAAVPEREPWAHLPVFLKTGKRCAAMDGSVAERSAAYRDLTKALGRLFDDAARELAAKLPRCDRILDIGAGSGVWSLAMAALSDTARVTAVDLPGVLGAFEDRAESIGLGGRFELIACDYHAIELPDESFDRVLLANVLHLEPPRSARSLIRRLVPTLAGGGELVVIDALGGGDPARDLARSIYALHLALRTTRGRVHPRTELDRWCREAGLRDGGLVTLSAPPGALGALIRRRPH